MTNQTTQEKRSQHPSETGQTDELKELSFATTSFKKLSEHKRPINQTAVNVVYFEGEHYDPEFHEELLKYTYDYPPKCNPRPAHEPNYTGLRYGNMTAIAWYKSHHIKPNQSYWVCRCDCGRYELRYPSRWNSSRYLNGDVKNMCCYCQLRQSHTKGKNFLNYQSVADRELKRINKLRAIGFTDDEITRIRKANLDRQAERAGSVQEIMGKLSARENGIKLAKARIEQRQEYLNNRVDWTAPNWEELRIISETKAYYGLNIVINGTAINLDSFETYLKYVEALSITRALFKCLRQFNLNSAQRRVVGNLHSGLGKYLLEVAIAGDKAATLAFIQQALPAGE